jgi:IclR family transcriptional regulator, mhp operon transcriptional activator
MAKAITSDSASGGREGVRALTRGLAILRYVNAAGDPRPSEIAVGLGLPRPTVYRLLQTLEEAGYISLSPTGNRVRVTRLAAGLGDGFAITSRICQAAGTIFATYAPKVVWPLDISVYENAAMVIQETTHGRSPLSIDRGMTGFRLPMLRTAAGRAYLAHCGEAERNLILDQVRRLDDPADAPFLEPRALEKMLTETRRAGLATRQAGEFRSKTASIAVPLMVSGTVAGSLTIIWTRQAMSLEEARMRYEAILREVAARVAGEIQE